MMTKRTTGRFEPGDIVISIGNVTSISPDTSQLYPEWIGVVDSSSLYDFYEYIHVLWYNSDLSTYSSHPDGLILQSRMGNIFTLLTSEEAKLLSKMIKLEGL